MNSYLKSLVKVSPLAFLLLAILTFIPSTQAASTITLSPPKFEEVVNPGETVQKLIKVSNGSTEEMTLVMSAQDFIAQGESGQQEYIETDPNNPQPHLLSSWIQYSSDPITIGPGQIAKIPFQISVPDNAEPGGHYATVFFSPPVPEDGQVAVIQRIGSLVLVRVSGEINEGARLDSFNSYNDQEIDTTNLNDYSPQKFFETLPVTFLARAENTGNVHTKVKGQIEIFNTFGEKLTEIGTEPIFNSRGLEIDKKIVDYIPVNFAGGNILPDSFRSFEQSWNGYPKLVFNEETGDKIVKYEGFGIGRYRAILTSEYGTQKTAFDNQEIIFWIIPWKIIAGIILLVIIIFIIIRFRRRSQKNNKSKIEDQIRQQLMEEMKAKENPLNLDNKE